MSLKKRVDEINAELLEYRSKTTTLVEEQAAIINAFSKTNDCLCNSTPCACLCHIYLITHSKLMNFLRNATE